MQNQAPLSPARVLYQELRENEDAGLLDAWPARCEATDYGDPVTINKVEPIHAVDGNAGGDSIQPRSALAAIIRLQSTEIERLALENDRLAERLDAVNQRIEDEQHQRRKLDQQLHEASLRNQPPEPAFDVEEIRRAAREGMSAEIKPVLMAILDLLESTLPRGAETVKPTAVPGAAPGSTPANLVAEMMEEFQQLPAILTRPLEELTKTPGDAGPAPDRVADAPAQAEPEEVRVRRSQPPRHQAQSSAAQSSADQSSAAQSSAMPGAMPGAMPSIFAWTNLFS